MNIKVGDRVKYKGLCLGYSRRAKDRNKENEPEYIVVELYNDGTMARVARLCDGYTYSGYAVEKMIKID